MFVVHGASSLVYLALSLGYVGRKCRTKTPKDVTKELRLDWHTVKALDKVRKKEYARLSGKENLMLDGRRALRKLLKANKRLHTAYLLKETFGQLWSYQTEGWAWRFFDHWKDSLKWRRLRPC